MWGVKRCGLPLLLLATLILGGCSMVASLIPVEGPLSQLRPIPAYSIKATGTMSGGGKLTALLEKGATCSGRWATASNGPTIGYSSGSLISQYGAVYLSGYSVAQSSGRVPGQGVMTCTDGKVIQAEFTSSGATGHGFGIAKDNEQNVYRLVF